MNIIEIITKKKNKLELTYEELEFAVTGFINKEIKDYQMSALLMAIVINGMSLEETYSLTRIMINSGSVNEVSNFVDKHSTGGVGDKTTLVLIPLVASCGVDVAKMSGRGLGHTGGTIDKLEAIEGYRVKLSKEEFNEQIDSIGCAVISQTEDIAVADKYIYALRDVTGTTESIPLIASSIMSKKIASGAKSIVIDLKVGDGALMKTKEDALELSRYMIELGKRYDRCVKCVLTDMSEPLGYAIGNGLEVVEALDTLKGVGPTDLEKLVLKLGSLMVSLGKNISEEEALIEIKEALDSKRAYNKFLEMVKRQDGNIENINISKNKLEIRSQKEGALNSIDAYNLGVIAKKLGAGRETKEDLIDYGVGIVLNKKVGDLVFEGELLATIYYNKSDLEIEDVVDCFEIKFDTPDKKQLIIETV